MTLGSSPPLGTLFAIGGAEAKLRRRSVLAAFVAAAGGADARIAVVPSASSLGEEVVEVYRAVFTSLGAREVIALRPQSRADAADPDLVEPLGKVSAIFMTGGNQLKLSAYITGTPFGDGIHEAYQRGAVVGGTSAGASILADHMIAFGSGGATPRQRMSQLSAGLGLLPGVVVDQHFEQRNRYGRLLSLVAQSPALLGMGVDEDTAAVVHEGRRLEVVGRGAVTLIDGRHLISNAFAAAADRPAAGVRGRLARAAERQPVRPGHPDADRPSDRDARSRGAGVARRRGRPAQAGRGHRRRRRVPDELRPARPAESTPTRVTAHLRAGSARDPRAIPEQLPES